MFFHGGRFSLKTLTLADSALKLLTYSAPLLKWKFCRMCVMKVSLQGFSFTRVGWRRGWKKHDSPHHSSRKVWKGIFTRREWFWSQKMWKLRCEKQTFFPALPHALKNVRTEGKQLCVCAHGVVDLFLSNFYTKEMYYFCTFHICFYDLGDVFLVQMDVESGALKDGQTYLVPR